MEQVQKSGSMSKLFDIKENQELRQYLLTDVTPTGKILGNGSYGSVVEILAYQHLKCAGKKIHETLIRDKNSEIVLKYVQECHLMSSLRHPNVTQFLGVCFLPESKLPLLVMEKLETSLGDLLDNMPSLPLSIKRSILDDVACGLVYLHNRESPVIHRDLTANNILLTASLSAKITDMGNSRIVNMKPGQLAQTLTKLPGTLAYMPPEVFQGTHYGPSLDIFSFGHLSLCTLTQNIPNLLHSTFTDNLGHTVGRSEVQRRENCIIILEDGVGRAHPSLISLVKDCLNDVPENRPTAKLVLDILQKLKMDIEGVEGGSLLKLDISRVLLAKEMKMKDKQINELKEVLDAYEHDSERTKHMRDYESQRNTQMNRLEELKEIIRFKEAQLQCIHQRELEVEQESLPRRSELSRRLQCKEDELRKLREKERANSVQQMGNTTEDGWEIPQSEVKLLNTKATYGTFKLCNGLISRGTRATVSSYSQDVPASKFTDELELVRALHHPSVVQLYGVSSKQRPFYIITEPIKSRLYDYLCSDASKSLTLPELINIGSQVAKALVFLESRNVIHCDVATRNVMQTDNMVFKLGNFSLAQVIEKGGVYKNEDGTKYPVKWLAPEAAQNNSFSFKSDVWSFGILLFEIITHGEVPYKNMSNTQVMEGMKGSYRIPRPMNCPEDFYSIMNKCWNYDPEARPTIKVVFSDLDKLGSEM